MCEGMQTLPHSGRFLQTSSGRRCQRFFLCLMVILKCVFMLVLSNADGRVAVSPPKAVPDGCPRGTVTAWYTGISGTTPSPTTSSLRCW